MGVSFLPSADRDLLAWSANVVARLADDPGSWGITVGQYEAFVVLQHAFADAMAVAGVPATRSMVAVSEKNAAREAMKAAARRIAAVVGGQADVTDAQRLELGLTVRAARTASAVPGAPHLTLTLGLHQVVTVALADGTTGNGARLPDGVFGAILMRHVGDEPPRAFEDYQFVGLVGRTVGQVTLGADVLPGATVWFTAAWFNARKELGPASDPASVRLALGPALNASRTTAILRRAA